MESLHRMYPGRYLTDVSGTAADAIFMNNPRVSKVAGAAKVVTMHNPMINECDRRPVHVLESYCTGLGKALGVPLPCQVRRPVLYLSDQEKGWLPQVVGKYWVVCSGYKSDYTTKTYGAHHYQEVIDGTPDIRWVQVGELGHHHRLLRGVLDLRGKTTTRELIRLAYHAQGGLGGESLLHHIFAALGKPFVCLASGFLPAHTWVSYPTTTILTRAGCLPCCKEKACWKSRVVPLGDKNPKDRSLCVLPVVGGEEPVAKCMDMIHPDEVVRAIRSYFEGGVL